MPPPFSTFQMLETLNILEGFDIRSWGHNSPEYLHHLIEGIKLASADRLAYAYREPVPIAGLLSKAYAASQRDRIDAAREFVDQDASRWRSAIARSGFRDRSRRDTPRSSPTSTRRTSRAPTRAGWSSR